MALWAKFRRLRSCECNCITSIVCVRCDSGWQRHRFDLPSNVETPNWSSRGFCCATNLARAKRIDPWNWLPAVAQSCFGTNLQSIYHQPMNFRAISWMDSPKYRKLGTPQNEWCPTDGIFESVIRKTSNFFNFPKIGPIFSSLFGPRMISTSTFRSKDSSGILCILPRSQIVSILPMASKPQLHCPGHANQALDMFTAINNTSHLMAPVILRMVQMNTLFSRCKDSRENFEPINAFVFSDRLIHSVEQRLQAASLTSTTVCGYVRSLASPVECCA